VPRVAPRFCFHRIRCRFHDGGGKQETQRDNAHQESSPPASDYLHGPSIAFDGGRDHRMRKYTTYFGDPAAVATAFAVDPGAALISAGALAGITLGPPCLLPASPAFYGDGGVMVCSRNILPASSSRRFDATHHHHLDWCFVAGGVAAVVDIGSLADSQILEHSLPASVCPWRHYLWWRTDANHTPVPRSDESGVSNLVPFRFVKRRTKTT